MKMTLTTRTTSAPVVPSTGALRPLGLNEVRITGGFWGDRQDVNGTATLSHIEHWLEQAGWLGNFDLAAAGELPDGRRGREFSDSEVYKYLEGLAWEIGRRGGADELEARFRSVVARVGAAQEADGYLNTNSGRAGQAPRWSDLEWGHELYCLGHLFQAAVARERTRPGADDGLLGIACRAADLICDVFCADGIQSICGHAEVEVGLAELGRVTGEQRYLAQAALFVERHGHGTLKDIEWGRSYFQDDAPVRRAEVLRGHAVRANYLSAGATDVAIEGNDAELLGALKRQWDRTIARRTYITGGQGSHHQDEAFGEDWELPPDRAYSETCAGVASIMFSWRLLLAENDVRYADLIERTLFNVVATSPSTEGTSFFYANTLHQRRPAQSASAEVISPRASSSLRAPWFEVACCPPNVARTFASLAAYVATSDDDGVQIHQYAPASIRTSLPDGRVIAVDIRTNYPSDGVIEVRVAEDMAAPTTLALRVPSWATSATLAVRSIDGTTTRSEPEPGYASVRRAFRAGDAIVLTLPMRPRFTVADPRIDAVRDCVAVERGPQVYCLESTDLPAQFGSIDGLQVDDDIAPLESSDGVAVTLRHAPASADGWPYATLPADVGEPEGTPVPLVPYNRWAERGPSTMRVWIPVHHGK
ncbi:MAG TPA: beta-L-arabinofuranosidase domain-containing protein [Terrimesophilobacter sp.]|nr:beta-L-arabinofuranosidase domain-containing protein [Terrimesophilobacter sp.]